MPEPLLSTAEVAAWLKKTPHSVTQLVRTKALPAHNISQGGRPTYRYERRDVEAFLKATRTTR